MGNFASKTTAGEMDLGRATGHSGTVQATVSSFRLDYHTSMAAGREGTGGHGGRLACMPMSGKTKHYG